MKYKELERIAVKAEWTITDKSTLYYIEKELRDYKENFRSYSNEGGNVYMNFKE